LRLDLFLFAYFSTFGPVFGCQTGFFFYGVMGRKVNPVQFMLTGRTVKTVRPAFFYAALAACVFIKPKMAAGSFPQPSFLCICSHRAAIVLRHVLALDQPQSALPF